jgi:predicted NUDIX family phosphoesterase
MEFVYVVKRYDLFDLSFPHGFVSSQESPEKLAAWVERIRERGFFVERRHAEKDSSLKQIIPYSVVRNARGEVLLLKRLRRGAEARLHDKLSIGVGGHVNPGDEGADRDVVAASCRREIEEELVVSGAYRAAAVGAINDESNDVGSVHFGLVFSVDAGDSPVGVRETDLLHGEFVAPETLLEQWRASRARFESWSDLILERWPLPMP